MSASAQARDEWTTEKLWEMEFEQTGVYLKRIYVDMAGNLPAGVLLSQIIYWFRPKDGKPRANTIIHGERWISLTYREWHDACGLTKRQMMLAIRRLEDLGLIYKESISVGYGHRVCLRPILSMVELWLRRPQTTMQRSAYPRGDL